MHSIYINLKDRILFFIRLLVSNKALKLILIKIQLGSFESGSTKTSLNDQNFILRGCSLRNTNHIYGLISYTG